MNASKELYYISTRGDKTKLTSSEAVIKGLCDDGGLYVPEFFPKSGISLDELAGYDYKTTAYEVMKLFFTDYTESELKDCINKAYDDKFDDESIAPLVKKGDQYFLELFHGKTIAFKDMALSILPHLLTTAMKKNRVDKEVVILTATSGDTGKAALAGFADVPGTRIIVFYPKGGVSRIQELQMVTEKGRNTKVVGVKGNFDDCQTGVKLIFNDETLRKELEEKGFVFSSANSINIGRLIPQVAYYFYAYGRMVKSGAIKAGDKLNFTVPTGNFGNILAAYYAGRIGLPVGRLVCASNENKVLFDFFNSGCYDRNRDFILTSSPSMDILVSSNLERLIYHALRDDAVKTASFMKELRDYGKYDVGKDKMAGFNGFYGLYTSEDEVFKTIRSVYEKTGYVIDTHTAVAAAADIKYRSMGFDDHPGVVISTASPYKFTRNVMKALGADVSTGDDFELVDELESISGVKIPPAVEEIRNADIIHDTVCEKEDMKEIVKSSLI
ncbi:MAG: threonine synthase [Lachnospiraceae bacterium]|nr:threonine synthase [Lachnospiraceae bacterium]